MLNWTVHFFLFCSNDKKWYQVDFMWGTQLINFAPLYLHTDLGWGFYSYYVPRSVSFFAVCDFDGHLIAASIWLHVGHSQWSLKELFHWLSPKKRKPCTHLLMSPLGFCFALTWKGTAGVTPLTCLRDQWACSWTRPINVRERIFAAAPPIPARQTAISRSFLFGKCYHPLITSSNIEAQMKKCMHPWDDNNENCESSRNMSEVHGNFPDEKNHSCLPAEINIPEWWQDGGWILTNSSQFTQTIDQTG